MNIGRIPFPGAALSVAVLGLSACADRQPLQPAPYEGTAGRTRIDCEVQVRAGEVRCGATATGARGNLILGGQGVNVRLASSGTSYDAGTSTLQSSVTVQNLLSQPIGTPDGTQVTGLRVFFASGPTVKTGTGTVEVLGDSVGTFTAAGQPYYLYPQMLAPGATSAPRIWRFSVPAAVTSFVFSVYVEARAPAESAVMRWITPDAAVGDSIRMSDVWSPDGQLVLAMGWWATSDTTNSAAIARSTDGGATWSVNHAANLSPQAVWGTSAADLWIADGYGYILHSTDGGLTWAHREPATTLEPTFNGVWSHGDTVVVSGLEFNTSALGWDGVLLRSVDGGATWTKWVNGDGPTDTFLLDVSGGGGELWAAGTEWDRVPNTINGYLAHSTDGGATWSEISLDSTLVGELHGVWSAPGAGVYAVGGRNGGTGVVLHSGDGGAHWNVETPTGGYFEGVWGTGAGDVYAAGSGGAIWHFDGTRWMQMASGTSQRLLDVFGTSPRNVWTVGEHGTILHGMH